MYSIEIFLFLVYTYMLIYGTYFDKVSWSLVVAFKIYGHFWMKRCKNNRNFLENEIHF